MPVLGNGALGVAPARRFTCFVWQSERRVEEGCSPFYEGFAMRGSRLAGIWMACWEERVGL